MDIEIIKASELLTDPRSAMSKIFVEGWYDVLKMLCKNKSKLQRAFEHMFKLDDFYVALVDQRIMAFIAVSERENERRVVHFDRKELRKHLGFIRGSLTNWALTKEMIDKKYPFVIPAGMGVVEFVATLPEARGKGLAGKLIEFVMADCGYQEYILEVVDTNYGAIKLYERLGFSEFTREKSKHPKKYSGFEYMIYMKRKNNGNSVIEV